MRLYLIRHAQSQNNILLHQETPTFKRVDDPYLSELGEKQAESLSQFFVEQTRKVPKNSGFIEYDYNNFEIERVYCSLMVRAIQTGSAISQSLDIPLIAWEEVHEAGGIVLKDNEEEGYYGRPGKNRVFFERDFPHLILPDSLNETGWWNCRPYEKLEAMEVRAKRVVDQVYSMYEKEPDLNFALITHGAFYNGLMKAFQNTSEIFRPWLSISNTAITRIDIQMEPRWEAEKPVTSIVYTNRVDFLPDELITA